MQVSFNANPKSSVMTDELTNENEDIFTDETPNEAISEKPESNEDLTGSENLERKSTLKRMFGDLPSNRLLKVIKALQEIYDAKVKEQEEQERKASQHQALMLKALDVLQSEGINVDDFKSFISSDLDSKLKNSKYVYTDLRGITRFWSGQGKTPTQLVEVMQRDGTSKDDYLRKGDDDLNHTAENAPISKN